MLFNLPSQFSSHHSEECGVFGISTHHGNAAQLTYLSLCALQHRGQEAAGIATVDGLTLQVQKGIGLVSQVFNETIIHQLQGSGDAIGHTRYSTTGSSILSNAQPFLLETRYGPMAFAHNGNLVNTKELRRELLERGTVLTSTSDSEVMAVMLAGSSGDTWTDRIAQCMLQWVGAYSIVVLTVDCVYAARDPWGFRPLSLGQLPEGNGYAVASETGALDVIGYEIIREVKAGEVVALHRNTLITQQGVTPKDPQALCSFEHIYFSRPDNVWDGKVVNEVRIRLGKQLAKEAPAQAEIVIPVPDSSVPAAIGYAQVSGIPFAVNIIKNPYIGRTFIQPSQVMRDKGVYTKFNPLPEVMKDKSVVVVDDSIVRGTTSRRLVKMLRKVGVKEVHMRITCPPITYPCYMGVDMPTTEELIAHKMSITEICDYIGADSLHYLSLEGMMVAIGSRSGYCNACFTGMYPFQVEVEE